MNSQRSELLPRWLFNSLAELRMDITELSWDPRMIEEDLNREVPDFDARQVIRSIRAGIDQGLLEIVDADDHSVAFSGDLWDLCARGKAQRFFLGLTEAGGAHWESLSRPIWEKFFNWGRIGEATEPYTVFIEACSKNRVNEVLQELPLTGYVPHPDTGRWSVVAPWEATYWKTFPEGHRLEFLATEVERDFSAPAPEWFSRSDFWYS